MRPWLVFFVLAVALLVVMPGVAGMVQACESVKVNPIILTRVQPLEVVVQPVVPRRFRGIFSEKIEISMYERSTAQEIWLLEKAPRRAARKCRTYYQLE